MPLTGRDVQRGVAIGGGGVGVGHVLQQQLHDLCLAQARGDVQWGLFFLQLKSSGSLVLWSHPEHSSSVPTDLPMHFSCTVIGSDNRKNGVMGEKEVVSDFLAMVLRGRTKHCKQNTYPGSGINQGPVPQEAANHFHLPGTCRHVQCSFSTLRESKGISVS